jgi:NAD(P)-dependent dehydrogenase (short-subunit alcohol dehydrogenase family)
MAPYTATKHAVVGVSEALAIELAMTGSAVKVSVLCPGFIKTRLHESDRNFPAALGDAPSSESDSTMGEIVRGLIEGGKDPAYLAQRVVAAVRADDFFILSDDAHAAVPAARAAEARAGGQPAIPDVSTL